MDPVESDPNDIDHLNALFYDAVRDGVILVGRDADGDRVARLTQGGFIKARVQATTLRIDPDALSDSQLLSVAVYGTPRYGEPHQGQAWQR